MTMIFIYPDVFNIKVDGKRNAKALKLSGEKFCIWGRPSDSLMWTKLSEEVGSREHIGSCPTTTTKWSHCQKHGIFANR